MFVLFNMLLLEFVSVIPAELCGGNQINKIQMYADTVFILSEVNSSIIGSTEKYSSALRCLQRCGQTEMYMSFYFSVARQECYCNTQLDLGAKSTTNDTGLIYGITYESSLYLPSDRQHVQQNDRDCLTLFHQGFSTDGVYIIHPVGGVAVEAWCDMTGGGWTVIQRRQDCSEDFYRPWNDYVNGFGNRTGEYWLGLENIRSLTEEASTLKIELESFGDVTPLSAVAEYSSFAIGSSASYYQLSVSGFSGDCGDSLVTHNGQAFTTYDQDNDIWSADNCAVRYQGAWWYKSCHTSNLNGMYLAGAHSSFADGINWHTCWGLNYSVKTSVMKIRRNC